MQLYMYYIIWGLYTITNMGLSNSWLVGWIFGLVSQINGIYNINRMKDKNLTSIPIDIEKTLVKSYILS